MATVTMKAAARAEGRYFYVWMGVAFVAIAFLGFVPTYWAPVATASFHGPRMQHVHGLVLTLWVLFYLVQSWLVASGRSFDHRNWGQAGIALFTVVICTILVAEIGALHRAEIAGYGDAARRFAAVTLLGAALIVGLFTAAIVWARRPDIHKRLMVVLMSAMMAPAIARVFIIMLAPGGGVGAPPPPGVAVAPTLIGCLLIVVGMVHDRRTIGRVHPAYLWGGLAVVTETLLTVPISASAGWVAFVQGFEALAK
jgi:hypothetical protein